MQAIPIDARGRDDFITTTADWFDAWLKHFGGAQTGIWRSSRYADLGVPFRHGSAAIGPLRIPVIEGASNSHTPRFDVLGPSLPPDAIDAMLRELGGDMLRFDFVADDSAVMAAARSAGGDLLVDVDDCEIAPYVDCTLDWDSYWRSRGGVRETWGRRERQLMGKMGARFECLTHWHEIEPRLASILAVEASGWKGKMGSAIEQSSQTAGFYGDLIRRWADEGRLRLFVLSLEDRPIAFELDALYRGRLNMFKVGYADDLSKQSPGQVLRIQVLKHAFADPQIEVFDMFGPASHGKLQWATATVELRTVRFMRRTARGRLAYLRFSTLPRLRARWRKRAAAPSADHSDSGALVPQPSTGGPS